MNSTLIVPIGLGVIIGAIASFAYFMHLAMQVRKLVNHASYRLGMLLSAVLRMSVFLATGWLLSTLAGPLSAVGYGVSFLLVRAVAIRTIQKEVGSCN